MEPSPQEHLPEHPRRPSFSLRLKLSLWMVLIFLVVQLSLVFVLQLYQRRSVDEYFNQRIEARVGQLADVIQPSLPDISDAALAQLSTQLKTMLFQKYFVLEVLDEAGTPIASSSGLRARLPADLWDFVRLTDGPEAIRLPSNVIGGDESSTPAAYRWVTAPSGSKYIVLLAWSDMYRQDMLSRLFTAMFFSIPIGVIAVAISAYAISGIAVQPIRAMRRMARGLQPEFLGQRVPISGKGAEVEELQQHLEATRQRLDAAFRSQERFMSNVSHELKTPIAVLLTEIQNLKADTAPPDVREFISSAMDELEKLGRTVDSFLLLTRAQYGKAIVPNQEFCLVRDIMVQSLEGCAPMADQHGVRIRLRVPDPPHEDAGVLGNCDLLRTVLDNLIRNAVRFTPKGASVDVIGRVVDGEVNIVVQDVGPGIPPALLPFIFDRFAQSTEEERRGRGHGLGLEIAMGITELHGGDIRVVNRAEGGCEFTITLPLAVDEATRVLNFGPDSTLEA